MWAHSSLLLPVNWQPNPNPHSHTHTVSHYLFHSSLPSPIFWNLYSSLLNRRHPPPQPQIEFQCFPAHFHRNFLFLAFLNPFPSHLTSALCKDMYHSTSVSPMLPAAIHPPCVFCPLVVLCSTLPPISLFQFCFNQGHQVICICSKDICTIMVHLLIITKKSPCPWSAN